MNSVGICGLGFVGSAIYNSLKIKKIDVYGYDKFKPEQSNCKLYDLTKCNFIILCLPTKFDSSTNCYKKDAIHDVCNYLHGSEYKGAVVIKSTVEPGTTTELRKKYMLNFIHNPEFLTARTAQEDFLNQKHIVLGKEESCCEKEYASVVYIHGKLFPEAQISQCTSLESESMKLFANCFYATKVQFWTEIYLLCQSIDIEYDVVIDLILKNGWVNPMHTTIPGPDGDISYGGLCFPKDTNALLNYMKTNKTPCSVIKSVISERNKMRDDNSNCV